MSVDVSIVIVSYRTADELRVCLDSLVKQPVGLAYETIVVDNASRDGSVEMLRRDFPWVRLIALDQNVGFAAASDRGAEVANGRYLLFLNPDTIILDNAVARLVDFAVRNPRFGVYGGRTLRPNGSLEPSSCWRAPTVWSLFCFAIGLSTVFKRSRWLNPEMMPHWKRDCVHTVDMVTGCLLLISAQLFHQLGGFDEDYFVYGEDADLNLRARASGWQPVITPDATIVHVVGASSRHRADKLILVAAGKITLLRKHWTPTRARVGAGLLMLGMFLRATASRVLPSGRSSAYREAWAQRATWRRGFPLRHRQGRQDVVEGGLTIAVKRPKAVSRRVRDVRSGRA